MLRDLLLGLLGFPGDILILDDESLRVRHDFDMLTIGERDQVNKMAPMGWFYLKLRNFVRDRTIKWENDHIGEGGGGLDDRKKSPSAPSSSSAPPSSTPSPPTSLPRTCLLRPPSPLKTIKIRARASSTAAWAPASPTSPPEAS